MGERERGRREEREKKETGGLGDFELWGFEREAIAFFLLHTAYSLLLACRGKCEGNLRLDDCGTLRLWEDSNRFSSYSILLTPYS